MKKIIFALSYLFIVGISIAQTELSKEERKKAISHLKKTQSELIAIVNDLDESQVQFKPDESSWSISECMEHITISEKNLIGMVKISLEKDSEPSRRSEIAMNDDQILGLISSREQKVKTRKEFEPTNSFGEFSNTLNEFKERRKSNIKFIKTTNEDFRNHYISFPFGLTDAYQGVLFMSGHTKRHTDQIKEIMNHPEFPN